MTDPRVKISGIGQLIGRKAVDNQGEKIGKITDVYLDDPSGEPEWFAVNTGLFGMRSSFVPIEGSTSAGDEVRLAYTKDQVKDAPNVDDDGGMLSPDEEMTLYRHYDRSYSVARTEEELTVNRETGKARLRRHVVTDHVE